MTSRRLLLPLVFLGPLVGCTVEPAEDGPTPPDEPTPIQCEGVEAIVPPSTIEEPTTWSCLVQFDGDLRIQEVLTIEPGTRIEMGNRIFIGEGGRIESLGTADNPVTFTSPNGSPGAGDWAYIDFDDTADNGNVFEHTVIEYGGDSNGMVRFRGAVGVSFRDVTVRHSLALALDLTDADVDEFARVTFAEIPDHPVAFHPSDLSSISDIAVEGTVQDENILVDDTGSRGVLTENSLWPAQSVPYEIIGDFSIEAEVDVDPGAVLDIREDTRMFVRSGGIIRTNGEPGNEVIIQSAAPTPAPGDWIYFDFKSDVGTGNAFRHTIIRHGGNNEGFGAITMAPDITIELDNVTFEDNLTCDVNDAGEITATETSYTSCP